MAILEKAAEQRKLTGGEALNAAETQIQSLQVKYDTTCKELESVRNELAIEKEKMTSLTGTIANLQSGEADRVAHEQSAADARARAQKERDEKHSADLREISDEKRAMEIKLKSEMSTFKAEAEKMEDETKSTHEAYRKSKEEEIDTLNK